MQKFLARAEKPKPFAGIYCLSSVKDALDEVLREYLVNVEKYSESKIESDIRILIGVLNVLIFGIVLLISFKGDFNEYKRVVVVLLSCFWFLSYLDSFIRHFFFYHVFRGKNKQNEEIKVVTKLIAPSTEYTALFYFGRKQIPNMSSANITNLYNERHELCYEKFFKLIREGVQQHVD